MKRRTKPTKEDALKVARYLGCRGAHQRPDGMWVPCADDETLQRISNQAEPPRKKTGKKKPKEWQELRERGVLSIQTLPGGGLVSGKSEEKAIIAARTVRPTDPDVFRNRQSARVRAQQMGCIGIRQYRGTDGDPVWMPCSNESDYRRSLGTSPQGRRDRRRREREMERRIERRLRKKELTERQEELYDDYEDTVEEYGKFDKGAGADGAHYVDAETNPFINEGIVCSNCEFWQGPNGCEIVEGEIEPNAICKLWIIDETRLKEKSAKPRKPRSDRLAATPAPKKDRIFGSTQNKPGSASAASNKIVLDETTIRSLTSKVREHNAKMRSADKPAWSMASLGKLKAVYRRGAGAFSVSHRPGMTRNQWAMGRVNAFLKMLEKGRPDNRNYTTDSDLLHEQHPWKNTKKTVQLEDGATRVILSKSRIRFDPDAEDGDGDGFVQDGTRFRRPAKPGIAGGIGRTIRRAVSAEAPQTPPQNSGQKEPSFFRKLGYKRPRPMLDEPQDTKRAFGRGGRRYSDRRYNGVHIPIVSALVGKARRRRPDEEKTMHVLGGTSGSYKSSMRREGFQNIPDLDNAVHIDPDDVKEMLPEYPGWVEQGRIDSASLVHEESRDVAEMALQQAFRNNQNVVYDTSGQFNNGFRTLRQARENGYKVIAHYTTGDVDTFMKGVKERQKSTGRGVPPWIVGTIAANLPGITREINRRGLFDEFYLWDTTEQGKRVLVARKVGDGNLEIIDDAKWKRYLNGGR